jgi:hypothetical protein
LVTIVTQGKSVIEGTGDKARAALQSAFETQRAEFKAALVTLFKPALAPVARDAKPQAPAAQVNNAPKNGPRSSLGRARRSYSGAR